MDKDILLQNHVKNFMGACKKIQEKYPNFNYKLKIHVDFGRIKYHRDNLYYWIPIDFWENNVVKSEGLIKSGNAERNKNSILLQPSDKWSLFILPGVDLIEKDKVSVKTYASYNKEIKFIAKDDKSVVIVGWWNLINKQDYYFKLSDITQKIN